MDIAKLYAAVDAKADEILAAERYIWEHAEPGYREWETHAYLKEKYEALGLTVHEFDRIPASVAVQSAKDGKDRVFAKIPGFWVDFETGRPGPRLAIFGEMDSLIVATHPECRPDTHAVHACGHNCQSAALYGVAAALAAPGALEGLSGSIRLIAVPAEELIELEFRRGLRDQGVIRYYGGKQELLWRGVLDDVDLSFMVHTASGKSIGGGSGSDGCILKEFEFVGRSAHAGGSPEKGINALYASSLALNAANALRETFVEKDYIRFHPIVTAGGSAVNAIPDHVTLESYVRGATVDAMVAASNKINRAFAGSAAAMGCGLVIHDMSGYAPRRNDPQIYGAFAEAAKDLFPAENINFNRPWSTGSSDMGDVACVMPAAHPHIGGAVGHGHGSDYFITDPVTACVTSAKVQVGAAVNLLKDDAALAKKTLEEVKPPYATIKEFLDAVDAIAFDGPVVKYEDDGSVKLF